MTRKTIYEWGVETGIKIIDPDGFDRTDPLLAQRLFTKEEFLAGAEKSTISNLRALNFYYAKKGEKE